MIKETHHSECRGDRVHNVDQSSTSSSISSSLSARRQVISTVPSVVRQDEAAGSRRFGQPLHTLGRNVRPALELSSSPSSVVRGGSHGTMTTRLPSSSGGLFSETRNITNTSPEYPRSIPSNTGTDRPFQHDRTVVDSRTAPSMAVHPGSRGASVSMDSTQSRPSCSRPHAHRRALDEGCAICSGDEILSEAGMSELVWCKAQCGSSVHKACFDEWEALCIEAKKPATCIFCRSIWESTCEC